MAKTPVCKRCGGKVLHGNLYCSEACGKIVKAADRANAEQLTKHGFEQDPETPNLWRKDGVAVTLEHVRQIGVPKAIEHHFHAVGAHEKR